jgi:hypothetical protein
MVRLALAAFAYMTPLYALAHSWYDRSCCDVRDCEPIPPDQVQVTPQGYITPDGQLIPFAEARVSALASTRQPWGAEMLIWFFGLICGTSLGFVLAGMMSAGKAADEEMERLEQILRREP